jgi:hypothetical protein
MENRSGSDAQNCHRREFLNQKRDHLSVFLGKSYATRQPVRLFEQFPLAVRIVLAKDVPAAVRNQRQCVCLAMTSPLAVSQVGAAAASSPDRL